MSKVREENTGRCSLFCYKLFGSMEYIEVAGVGQIKVRQSANIKFLSVRMAPGRGMWVNVPLGVSRRQAEHFLQEKREWMLKTVAEMGVYEEDTGMGLRVGAEIKTKLHVLKIVETGQSKPFYKIEQDTIVLSVPEHVVFSQIEKVVGRFLVEIYAMEARQYLPQRVKEYAGKYGFRYGHLSFRDNISNWGSCSFENNISLNIKLMKLPDEIIDYVILHELSHTVEKNHSADFWALVGKICPDYKTLRHRLKKYNTRI